MNFDLYGTPPILTQFIDYDILIKLKMHAIMFCRYTKGLDFRVTKIINKLNDPSINCILL